MRCFVIKSVYDELVDNGSIFSLDARRTAPLRLYNKDDESGRMIKIEIEIATVE